MESEEDPAYPVIRRLIENKPHASVVVAGHATRCAQKVHNMLAAIKKADGPDVYIFADADISPGRTWLREMVLPLSRPSIAATTGFRWLHLSDNRLSKLAHLYANVFLYELFAFVCFVSNVGLWGGSMAIRRKDFEDMRIGELWANASVDDMSLSRVIVKEKKKAILVPRCVTHSDDVLPRSRDAVRWFARQCMYLKTYHRSLWTLAIPLGCLFLLCQLWLFAALAAAIFRPHLFLAAGGGPTLLFLIGEMALVCLQPLLGPVPRFFRILLLHPIYRLTPLFGLLATVGMKKILWGGILYTLGPKGTVANVERLQQGT